MSGRERCVLETRVHGKLPGTHLTDLPRPWRRIGERAEMEEVRIHDLRRHSYASLALALGDSLTMIGKLLGHTQVQATARHVHLARVTGSMRGILSSDQVDDDTGRRGQ